MVMEDHGEVALSGAVKFLSPRAAVVRQQRFGKEEASDGSACMSEGENN